jgi:tRNA threonylcarbamoyladenosine biosynthesis protein TsaB
MTVLLALDSSTETMALALSGPAGRLYFEAAGGPQASVRLVPEALALLARANLSLADVDAIAFGCGPGAFTGLRAACAVAQGLAFGAGKPVLSIDSLLLVAEDARQQAAAAGQPLVGPIWVAMDARIGEIYAAAYRFETAGFEAAAWVCVEAPALYKPEALRAHWRSPAAVAGSALTVYAEALWGGDAESQAEAEAGTETQRRWPHSVSRASALAELAVQAWASGALLDAALAMPVYVRDKVAQTTAERLAARAALPVPA